MKQQISMWKRWLGAFLLVLLTACASGPNANPKDPLEPFNRSMSRFNDGVDEAVLKPVAEVYRDATPDLVRTGVSNFFSNMRDLWSFINAAAQLRPKEAAENFMRFNVNTFMGVAGIFDVASEMGIPRTKLDFGQTLGRWGVPSGPYLVLPLFGPSTFRDTAGFTVEARGDPVQGIDTIATRNSLYALRAVEARANLLRASSMLEGAALDKYSFTRDAYMQRRESQIEALIELGIGVGTSDEEPVNSDTKSE
ncbi:VacJ family lipoprotein [Hydrogenophaga sp.]|uniref:MlaA family lipoprotein n=1 Tax=Hydrogenophaga sp. TaxID=1904254 RepID=UPI0035614CD8